MILARGLRGWLALAGALAGLAAAAGACAQAASWHLDSSFGRRGVARVPGGNDLWTALAPGPHGSLFVGGGIAFTGKHLQEYLLEQLSRDGKLVKSFGHDGVATAPIDPEPGTQLFAVGGGKVLVAGLAYASKSRLGLARFTAAGRLDRSFGHHGLAQYNLPNTHTEVTRVHVALEPDGDILAAYEPAEEADNVVLVRMLPSGALDDTFGSGGFLTLDGVARFPDAEQEYGEALGQLGSGSDGSILLGYDELSGKVQELSAAGVPVASFGSNGLAGLSQDLDPHQMYFGALFGLPGGGVELSQGDGSTPDRLIRLTPAGAIDPTFGNAGALAFNLPVQAVALGPGGETFYLAADATRFVIGGVLNSGAPDPALPTGSGKGIVIDLPDVGASANGGAVLPEPGIVSILEGGYVAQISE
jgi:uncharacterized delta-60 repeat protein